MSKIRDDLEGVIIIVTDAGPLVLRAGDEVPEGVTVGGHVLSDEGESDAAVEKPLEKMTKAAKVSADEKA